MARPYQDNAYVGHNSPFIGSRTPLTSEEREAAFQDFLARERAAIAAGKPAAVDPWHGGDIEKRRELFMRRWSRPEAVSATTTLGTPVAAAHTAPGNS